MTAMSHPCRRLGSTHPVLGLLLTIAISACALWGAMDVLVRVTGIAWPI